MGPSAEPTDSRRSRDDAAEIRTFLIADVRGYTLFTQERGDEAAAKLASKFAQLARQAVDARDGSVIELRGDEALAVFASPRQAIRAAVEMQDRFVDETLADTALPLTVGIGLDAGEAVPVEGGYRGGALNQAARLCGLAGPGEILASREVVHLARTIDGIDYQDRGDVRVKGLADPVRVIAVASAERAAAPRLEPIVAERRAAAVRSGGGPRRHASRRRVLAIALAMALIAGAVAVPLILRGGPSLANLPANSIGRIDAASGRILGAIPLDLAPGEMTSGSGAVWITNPNDGRVTRVDPQTNSIVDTIDVGGLPSAIAAGAGGIWVTDETGPAVDLISPQTNAVVARYPVGNGPSGVAVGLGSVWVADRLDGSVTRLDAQTGHLQARILVGQSPTAIAVGAGGVWVTDSGGERLLEISPSTNALQESIPVGGDPEAIAIGANGIWTANAQDDNVSHVVVATRSEAARLPAGQGPSSIAITGETVWVTNRFDGTVSRLAASGAGTATTIRTGSAPVGSAIVGGDLWVIVQGALTSHRGGTLRIVTSQGSIPSVDPLSFDPFTWQALIMTNDGLVGFNRTGGSSGATLVPDLATAVPTPTSGGRVYAFQLRSGIHYSTGTAVLASDLRRALERGFQVNNNGTPANADFYDAIVGADACNRSFLAHPGHSTCDLSRGVVVDDQAGTIEFHLSHPDPDFLQKLAMPFAFAVPAGVPMSSMATTPIPATGPYRFASYDAKVGLTLVRNGRFHMWSESAQPDGFPDRIQYTFGVSPADQVRDVEQGTADAMLDPPPADAVSTLTTRYAGRVHPFVRAGVSYVILNTTMPPFDNELARRAVNYAFDRAAVLRLVGGQNAGRIACQLLPPNFPGYEPYCPYTSNPNRSTGAWSGPLVGRAQRLITQSGTRGARVEVWASPFATGGRQAQSYVAGLLRSLGYDAVVPRDQSRYFALTYPPGPGVQVALDGYFLDYPAAHDFLQLFECGSTFNLSRLCNARLQKAIRRASAAQVAQSEHASQLWAQADKIVTDLSPAVFYQNDAGIDFLSARAGNNVHSMQWGLLLDQLWVQ
ncbi:MAG TPA: ABC transporter substrate-binding protein [Actinomycetota bacterium]|jgi:peptide/nickel transport system substrate-binding protein